MKRKVLVSLDGEQVDELKENSIIKLSTLLNKLLTDYNKEQRDLKTK